MSLNTNIPLKSVTYNGKLFTIVQDSSELPLTTYTIEDFNTEVNCSRNGSIVTYTESSENMLWLDVDPNKLYTISYNGINVGLCGYQDSEGVFDTKVVGTNTITVTGASTWYFYPLNGSSGTYEIHNLNIQETLIARTTPTTTSSDDLVGQIDASEIWVGDYSKNDSNTYVYFGIPNYTYLYGVDVVREQANDLRPENILSGKSILNVEGSLVVQKYYTGSTAPSASFGNDGDLYLKVVR